MFTFVLVCENFASLKIVKLKKKIYKYIDL
jgi:hypothetical protein